MQSPFGKRSATTVRSAVVGSLALLGACTKNTGADARVGGDTSAVKAAVVGLVNDATGPSPEVAGAKPGGTITVYYNADFEHLDPARNFVNGGQCGCGTLMYRTLTAPREKADGGSTSLAIWPPIPE